MSRGAAPGGSNLRGPPSGRITLPPIGRDVTVPLSRHHSGPVPPWLDNRDRSRSPGGREVAGPLASRVPVLALPLPHIYVTEHDRAVALSCVAWRFRLKLRGVLRADPGRLRDVLDGAGSEGDGRIGSLTERVCEAFDLRDGRGGLQRASCHQALRALEAGGHVSLPPPRPRGGAGRKPRELVHPVAAPDGVPGEVGEVRATSSWCGSTPTCDAGSGTP